MAGKTKIPKAILERMKAMRRSGRTLRDIAAFFDINPNTVLFHVSDKYRAAKRRRNRAYAAAQNKN
jgi:DNA-binding CsgD family transcriptional regulator